MKVKAIIQSHYPERKDNLYRMIADLNANEVSSQDILLLIDYPTNEDFGVPAIKSDKPMPINWWHTIAPTLECDYVALLCDDLTLKPESISELITFAKEHPEIDVFGYEGGRFARTANPYTNERSRTVRAFKEVDYVIRFYFAKPQAFTKALSLHDKLPEKLRGHDDLILSIANKCALVPSTPTMGWLELSEYGVAYSGRPEHYDERNGIGRYYLDHINTEPYDLGA